MEAHLNGTARRRAMILVLGAAAIVSIAIVVLGSKPTEMPSTPTKKLAYKPAQMGDSSGFAAIYSRVPPWSNDASLEQIAQSWTRPGYRMIEQLDADLQQGKVPVEELVPVLMVKASLLNSENEADKAYEVLTDARREAELEPSIAEHWLYTVIAFQGITALRRGETDNCVLCRGESSCILPIAPSAVHLKPNGSRLAIRHFTEYLTEFPESLEMRWLLNVAHMTLGEHPDRVEPRYRISLDRYNSPEFAIGKFRDVGHILGINRLNQAGGAILDDFDNDDQLDIVFTSLDPTVPMVFYRNKGDGTFEDKTQSAGVLGQLGGLYCVQADYNNDGHLDLFIPRGAWLKTPMRPTLLKNNGNGTFTDVTREAGLLDPVNSITAQWADYDNDGWLDLFVCNETGPNRLYHNKGNGTFEEVAAQAGMDGRDGGTWKGVAWIDYDGDRYPDLFLSDNTGSARLYRNNRNGTFSNVSESMGIDGPQTGFSCWAFDYDNDGWPDLFATSYEPSLADVVKGLIGEPHDRHSNRLYRNLGGKKFQDATKEAGLDMVFAAMGSNFGDFDNDGYLDFYLGTGDPQLSTLVPNRLFRNLGGRRFVDITGSSGTGHLQKGHAVACGDWRRCGLTDILIEMGGAVNGDRYHNVLFLNPGQGNNAINVKLVGTKTNRSAIGARIKIVTAGEKPQTVYRWVSSGSSFGANPLEQSIGLGRANRIALLEVYWPTSGATQTFRDLDVNQFIEVTESAREFRKRTVKTIKLP
jgi:hypothetical protein